MSLRETEIPRQAVNDREYRPETEVDRKRAALLKEVDEAHALAGRVVAKFESLKAKLLALPLK